tara:strand:+ start:71 stop:892 length:822 start_codon:yes stop_codon:yes gene_type:complete
MENATIFCLTLEPEHEEIIKKLSYIPVGLGEKKFSNVCFTDKTGQNISHKNAYYGEYTFHYWLWKNYLSQISTEWVGFCQYRKFFVNSLSNNKNINFEEFKNMTIREVVCNNNDFDCILGEQFFVNSYKLSKIIKNHLFKFLSNPSKIFNKEKRSLAFHFDLFHGKGNLKIASDLLNGSDKNDFSDFMTQRVSFNPHNMFICKKDILENYYKIIFPWLEKCESVFGFNDSQSYGLKRIYGFLAERFLSYWFLKNYKVKEMPILFKDITDYKNL